MPRKRIQALQALRALAFLMVFVSHCSFIKGVSGGALLDYAGAAGVSIFLVLTGFLWYVNGHDRSLPIGGKGSFERVLSKARRFYPLHLATLLAALPFLALFVIKGGSVLTAFVELAFNVTLLQSWVPVKEIYFSLNGVSWYLSTYLFLALVAPYVVTAVGRSRWLETPLSAVMACVVLFAAECMWSLLAFAVPASHWLVYVFPPARVFELIAGAVVGRLYVEHHNEPVFCKISLGGGVLAAMVEIVLIWYTTFLPEGTHTFFLSAAWLIPSCLLVCSFAVLEESPIGALFRLTPVITFGGLGLELFMVHQLVIRYWTALDLSVLLPALVSFVCCLALSVVAALAAKRVLPSIASSKKAPAA